MKSKGVLIGTGLKLIKSLEIFFCYLFKIIAQCLRVIKILMMGSLTLISP